MDRLSCDEFIEAGVQEKVEFLNNHLFSLEKNHNDMIKEFEKYTKLLLRASKNDNYGPLARYTESSHFKDILAPNDENKCFNVGTDNNTNGTNNESALEAVRVKTEKLSISKEDLNNDASNMPAPKMAPPKTKRVKKEKISNVGISKLSVVENPVGTKRVTRSKTDRTSDVILQNPVVPVVDLRQSSGEDSEVSVRSTRTRTKKKAEATPIRSTRTRTKKTTETKENEDVADPCVRATRTKTRTKRERSKSEAESRVLEFKRSKSDSSAADDEQLTDDLAHKGAQNEPVTNNISSHTEYEDAVSHLENKPNETFVISVNEIPNLKKDVDPNLLKMNDTVVLDSGTSRQNNMNNMYGDDMITDDESEGEQVVSPEKKAKQANIKQVFSPYENSPVKKKVQAFEKFQKNENVTTSKMNTSKILREIEENKGNVKEKAKGFVGSSTSIYKINPSSASKIGKYIGHKTSVLNSSMSLRGGTTPSSDFKERELRRLEREKEMKKKEMMKQALSEERKKKHEEKMQRIQQLQKEAKEREMEKALEMQRIKEERVKMVLQQKEERQRLLKEENDRKRLLAKQRAEEKRKEEEALKLAMQDKKEQRRKIEGDISQKKPAENPIYLTQPTPRLPCADCYDSDDERHTNKKNLPRWTEKPRIKAQDYIQTSLGHRIKNTMFCCQSQSIDLRDVFKMIDPRKLKRTSSANWDKPPRFTLLPPLQDD